MKSNYQKQLSLPLTKVKDYLATKDSYTKYKTPTRKFNRLKAHAGHINEIWCMDLAIVDKLAKENGGIQHLLVCVDVFSRFVRVQPMKDKYAQTCLTAFNRMIKSLEKAPEKLWTDQGKEFEGKFKQDCESRNIQIYHTNSDTKAALAERTIRSLKRLMYRFMEEEKTYVYINRLQDFVNVLNSRQTRALGGKAPKDITNGDFLQVSFNHKNDRFKNSPKFKIGDKVRLVKYEKTFSKGYKQQFTDEIFIVYCYHSQFPLITCGVMDLDGEIIAGKFYQQELVRVIK